MQSLILSFGEGWTWDISASTYAACNFQLRLQGYVLFESVHKYLSHNFWLFCHFFHQFHIQSTKKARRAVGFFISAKDKKAVFTY